MSASWRTGSESVGVADVALQLVVHLSGLLLRAPCLERTDRGRQGERLGVEGLQVRKGRDERLLASDVAHVTKAGEDAAVRVVRIEIAHAQLVAGARLRHDDRHELLGRRNLE